VRGEGAGSWKDLGAVTAGQAGGRANTVTHGERPKKGGTVACRGRAVEGEGDKGDTEGEPPYIIS